MRRFHRRPRSCAQCCFACCGGRPSGHRWWTTDAHVGKRPAQRAEEHKHAERQRWRGRDGEGRAAVDSHAVTRASLAASQERRTPRAAPHAAHHHPTDRMGVGAVCDEARALVDGPGVSFDFATPPRTKGFANGADDRAPPHSASAAGGQPKRLHSSLAEFVLAMRRRA